MSSHAPPTQIRPPDPHHSDHLPKTHYPTEGIDKQINPDVTIDKQNEEATVHIVATHGRFTTSGHNLQKVNRGNDSPPQKNPNPSISEHSSMPLECSVQATISGDLPIGKNGAPTTELPTTAHPNYQNIFNDQFPPLTSNFNLPNRNQCSNNQVQRNVNPPHARQNAKDNHQPVDHIHTNHISTNNIQQHPQQCNVFIANSNVHPSVVNNAQQVIGVPVAQLNQKFNQPQAKTAPVPPNVVPSYAARLRASQAFGEEEIDVAPPLITTKQGLPAVIFKREDFMHKLATKCKYTLIGKFSNTMPKMEVIRSSLTSQLQIKGACKVTHFNSTHVYIDLDNEIDHAVVWNKERIFIGGRLMRLLIWTPTFAPEEETPIAPVWVVLPQLPWHCYTMAFVSKLLEPVGRVLFFDAASIQRTRGSVAKVKIEIDITKPMPPHVWLGFPQDEGDVYGEGRWQELQFENIPDYCSHCKHQGHPEISCKIKLKDEEYHRKKKEQEEKARNQKGGKNDIPFDQQPTTLEKEPEHQFKNSTPETGQSSKERREDMANKHDKVKSGSTGPTKSNAQQDDTNHKKMNVRGRVQKQQYVAKPVSLIPKKATTSDQIGDKSVDQIGEPVLHEIGGFNDLALNQIGEKSVELLCTNAFDFLAEWDHVKDSSSTHNNPGSLHVATGSACHNCPGKAPAVTFISEKETNAVDDSPLQGKEVSEGVLCNGNNIDSSGLQEKNHKAIDFHPELESTELQILIPSPDFQNTVNLVDHDTIGKSVALHGSGTKVGGEVQSSNSFAVVHTNAVLTVDSLPQAGAMGEFNTVASSSNRLPPGVVGEVTAMSNAVNTHPLVAVNSPEHFCLPNRGASSKKSAAAEPGCGTQNLPVTDSTGVAVKNTDSRQIVASVEEMENAVDVISTKEWVLKTFPSVNDSTPQPLHIETTKNSSRATGQLVDAIPHAVETTKNWVNSSFGKIGVATKWDEEHPKIECTQIREPLSIHDKLKQYAGYEHEPNVFFLGDMFNECLEGNALTPTQQLEFMCNEASKVIKVAGQSNWNPNAQPFTLNAIPPQGIA